MVSRQVRELESEMNDIGQWLVSAGQTLLAETSIGTTTDQAEALLREHEAIELKCRVRTFGLSGCLVAELAGMWFSGWLS